MRFYCIGDEETVRGFRLAGVDGQAVCTRNEAAAALARAVSRDDCGVILLSEAAAALIEEETAAVRLERSRPLIVEIPGPAGPASGRKNLMQMVSAAVGVRLEER